MPLSPLCATASAGPTAFPAQRPLARRRVILSRQVITYYGLIRGSDLLPANCPSRSLAGLCRNGWGQSVPAFICMSFLPCRLPYPGGPDGTDCWTFPSALAFGISGQPRRPRLPRKSQFTRGPHFGATKFALCCGPASCSPFTDKGFYLRAFVLAVACGHVEYDYPGKQSIPRAGLPPAGHAALQAATRPEVTRTASR